MIYLQSRKRDTENKYMDTKGERGYVEGIRIHISTTDAMYTIDN